MISVKKWILSAIAFLLFIIVLFLVINMQAQTPVKNAEEKAIAAAQKKVKLSEIIDVQIYNGNETYYVLKGKNQKGQTVIVWVPEKSGKVIVRKMNEGITRQQAVTKLLQEESPKKIISVKLGILKGRECWEIYYISHNNLVNYYYIDFETGEWLRKIKNM